MAVVVGVHTQKIYSHEMTRESCLLVLLTINFLWLFALSRAEHRSSLILFRFNLFSFFSLIQPSSNAVLFHAIIMWNFCLFFFLSSFSSWFCTNFFIMHKQFSPHYRTKKLFLIIIFHPFERFKKVF